MAGIRAGVVSGWLRLAVLSAGCLDQEFAVTLPGCERVFVFCSSLRGDRGGLCHRQRKGLSGLADPVWSGGTGLELAAGVVESIIRPYAFLVHCIGAFICHNCVTFNNAILACIALRLSADCL